ncbi:MAG: hypothetical protein RJA22_1964 [Verrucomicrobiota bacterium]
MPEPGVHFTFEQQPVRFRSVADDDHMLRLMRQTGTFYEQDVLLRLRDRLQAGGRRGAAIDAGGFIGTHSVFLRKFCGLQPVLTFEASPGNHAILRDNLQANGVGDDVIAVNLALGAQPGHAAVLSAEEANRGRTRVELGSTAAGHASIPVTTLDTEVQNRQLPPVAAIKIDVEGVELEVLRGGLHVITSHRPVLCIEIHSADHLRQALALLNPGRYWIVDCLGYSPTYLLEPCPDITPEPRRHQVNQLWIRRAQLPRSWSFLRKFLRRRAQKLAGTRWDPPPKPRRSPAS